MTMLMKNLTYIRLVETLAADIISSYEKRSSKPITLPIPAFDISEKLFHLRIDTEKLRGKLARTSGMIIPEKRWIILNNELDQARLNFTIAHELGHWLIDSTGRGLSDGENLLTYPLANREPVIQEGLANYFAGALLMPKSLLIPEARRYKGIGNFQLMALASKFGVSINAMSIRLGEIGNELDSSKTPLRLYEPVEYSDMYLGIKRRWKYTIVNANYSIIDHNLRRKLQSLKNQSNYLYVMWPREKLEYVETLLEFQCIDGFISEDNLHANRAAHYLGTDPSIRFVEIENGLWLDNLEGSHEDLKNDAFVFFPREDEQLTFLKREIRNVNQYIETPFRLNHRKEAKRFIEAAKATGKRVVITTGCFDLITNAHVRFLKRAKASGDILIVGLEDDNRVRAFKGRFRPVNTIAQRLELMEAFQFVDFAFVICGSPKLELKKFYAKLHQYLRADILAVSENDPNIRDRREEIESGGGTLAIVSQIEESTTTSLLRQFLAETELSDIVYISRHTIKDYLLKNDRPWSQLVMPIEP
jgi:D-glycero-beta-D-manno-heptose 1-phosphate adenylyltransferase